MPMCDNNFPPLFGAGAVPGWFSEGDMLAVQKLVEKLPGSGLLVEVGCFLGKSTMEWARGLQAHGKEYKLICIDSFNSPIETLRTLLREADFDVPPGETQLELFKHYTQDYPNVWPVRGFFNERFVFPTMATIVFEDSTHDQAYLAHALPFWWSHIEQGGILCGHDYMDEVQTAVDLFAALHDLTVNTFENSGIWYIEKNKHA